MSNLADVSSIEFPEITDEPRKPLVYVAGPYTAGYPIYNTRNAILVGLEMIERGLVTPVVPHFTMVADLISPKDYDFWMKYDEELLHNCAAMYRMPGLSSGADQEEMFAKLHNIPVFYSLEELYDWVQS